MAFVSRCTLAFLLLAASAGLLRTQSALFTGIDDLQARHDRHLLEACASQKVTECPLSTAPHLLFLGNSFTRFCNLPDMVMDQLVAAGCGDTTVATHIPDGYRFVNHTADLANSNSPLYNLLGIGRPAATTYTHAVFQDQSQVPGFFKAPSGRMMTYTASARAFQELAAAAKDAGVKEPMLFNTWGYRTGDPVNNPTWFPNYQTMQYKLDSGYNHYQRAFVQSAKVVKVGLGWMHVYHDEGSNADSKLFKSLYNNDGKHPALAGSYLSALTIANSIAGVCLIGGPVPAGSDDNATYIQLQCTACKAYLGQALLP